MLAVLSLCPDLVDMVCNQDRLALEVVGFWRHSWELRCHQSSHQCLYHREADLAGCSMSHRTSAQLVEVDVSIAVEVGLVEIDSLADHHQNRTQNYSEVVEMPYD